MKIIIKRLVLFITIIVLWGYAATKVNPLFIPSPKSVINALIVMWNNGQLINGLIYSFRRIAIATTIAGIIAIPLGLGIYNFKFINDTFYPIISLMRYLPITAFYPLLIMWFGIGETMKIAFLFLTVFVYMLPSVLLSLQEINQELIETGATLGMNKLKIIYMIQLPAALPSILNGYVMMFGIGFSYISVVEQINAVFGLGYIIQQSSSRGRTDLVFMGIFTVILISIVFDNVAKMLIKKIFRWKYLKEAN